MPALSPQEQLIHAIASISSNKPSMQVRSIITAAIAKAEASFDSGAVNSTGVTPLIICCDKGQMETLEIACEYYNTHGRDAFEALWGDPSAKSTSGGNTALHHAAANGFAVSIVAISRFQPETSPLSLLTASNDHNDTPIHMAATNGHVGFIEESAAICRASLMASNKLNKKDVRLALRTCFGESNAAGDTALSLAYGHGHLAVVKTLLGSKLVKATPDDISKCRVLIDQMEWLERKQQASAMEPLPEAAKKKANTQACLKLMEIMAAKDSDEQMSTLLDMVDNESMASGMDSRSGPMTSKMYKKLKRKMKKSKRSGGSHADDSTVNTFSTRGSGTAHPVYDDDDEDEDPSESTELMAFHGSNSGDLTMKGARSNIVTDDGNSRDWNVVDKSHRSRDSEYHAVKEEMSIKSEKKKDKKERRQRKAGRAARKSNSGSSVASNELERQLESSFQLESEETSDSGFPIPPDEDTPPTADLQNARLFDTLDALHLDVPDILKTSLSMAQTLSSSQLDGIETVLLHQIQAVVEARRIKIRLRGGSKE